MLIEEEKQPAVVFDLGGVLIDWNPRHLFEKMFNGNEAEMDYFLTVVCPLEWNEEQDAGRPFAEAIAERSEMYPQYAPYIHAYHGRWIETIRGEMLDTVAVLAELRDGGYPLYALSNWSAETFPLVKSRFEFLSWFDEIVISGQVKMAKPETAIFEYLLQRISREAEDCLFIDDNERNILAATRFGFQTIHFSTADHLRSELRERSLISSGGDKA